MTEPRRIEMEIELPVPPEEAWEAIATGPGITAWFMPAEVEGRVGGSVVHHHDSEAASVGTIIGYERPRRFAYEESSEDFLPDEGPRTTATEFLVEARSGGTCVVRVVTSGFGDGEAWERAVESFTAGWRQALASLRLYLTHFRGEPVAAINVGTMVKAAGAQRVWSQLTGALGVPERPEPGDRVATRPGVPPLAGTVEEVGEHMVTVLLDQPARGIGLIGVGGPGGDEVYATVRAHLFGAEAGEVAAREQAAWHDTFTADLGVIRARFGTNRAG